METNQPKDLWPTPARYFAATILILGVLGLILFIKPVFDTVALGFIISFLLFSPLNWVSRHLSGRYGLAVALIYLLLFALLIFMVLAGLGIVVRALQSFSQSIVATTTTFQIPAPLPEPLTSAIKAVAGWLVQNIDKFGGKLAGLIGLAFVAVFFSALLMLNLKQARGALAKWVPEGQPQKEVLQVLRQLDKVWVGYMTAQLIYCIVLGVASWVEYALLGVPYPVTMAIITGVVSLIPTIGGMLASFIVAIPCMLFGSTVLTGMTPLAFTILVFAINIVITQVSYNFIALPVIGKFVRLPVAAVLIGVLAGVAMGNILLAFLVVPILSTLTIFGGYLLTKVTGREVRMEPEVVAGQEAGFFSQMLSEK